MSRATAYLGNRPFVFLSYAHEDQRMAIALIFELQKKMNVWFDEGIVEGSVFDQSITDHINRCTAFLFLVSEESLKSDYCRGELYLAKEKNKKIFLLFSKKDIKLPDWFTLRRFSEIQRLNLYGISYEHAIEELIRKNEKLFNSCAVDKNEKQVVQQQKPDKPIQKEQNKAEPALPKFDAELEQIYHKVKVWAISQTRVKLSTIVINFDVSVDNAKRIIIALIKEGILENGTATDEGFKVIKR